jgi:hypothetical protein
MYSSKYTLTIYIAFSFYLGYEGVDSAIEDLFQHTVQILENSKK